MSKSKKGVSPIGCAPAARGRYVNFCLDWSRYSTHRGAPKSSGQIQNIGKSFSLGKHRGPDKGMSRKATSNLARGGRVAIEEGRISPSIRVTPEATSGRMLGRPWNGDQAEIVITPGILFAIRIQHLLNGALDPCSKNGHRRILGLKRRFLGA